MVRSTMLAMNILLLFDDGMYYLLSLTKETYSHDNDMKLLIIKLYFNTQFWISFK